MTSTIKRVALITGCGKENGIGAAVARKLSTEGCAVIVSDAETAGVNNDNTARKEDTGWRGLETLVAEITDAGGTAHAILGDVSTEEGANTLVATAMEIHGRIDVLVNNAGAPHGNDRGDIETIPVEAWYRVMGINALGPFLMMRAVLPHMKTQGGGRIVNMASVAGMYALPQRAIYCASKAAVVGMTRSVAYDLAPLGITVNAVCPGSIRTDRAISTTLRAGWNDVEAGLADRARQLPMRRHGLPKEVAATVAHLASEEAGYITGQAIIVDGGGLPPHAV
ncbi:MAG: SDR family NAD(P)-dependent oxidoreductase [Hyphomicrobiaceae bacterium]